VRSRALHDGMRAGSDARRAGPASGGCRRARGTRPHGHRVGGRRRRARGLSGSCRTSLAVDVPRRRGSARARPPNATRPPARSAKATRSARSATCYATRSSKRAASITALVRHRASSHPITTPANAEDQSRRQLTGGWGHRRWLALSSRSHVGRGLVPGRASRRSVFVPARVVGRAIRAGGVVVSQAEAIAASAWGLCVLSAGWIGGSSGGCVAGRLTGSTVFS
jgi:hypothetical protein